MKEIFLVGNNIQILDNINNTLKNDFSVQLSANSPDLVKGLLNIVKPDLTLFIPDEKNVDNNAATLDVLKNAEPKFQVFCIDINAGKAAYAKYLADPQFTQINCAGHYAKVAIAVNDFFVQNEEIVEVVPNQKEPETPQKRQKMRRINILLVDDNSAQLRILNNFLCDRYDVTMVTSGVKALDTISKRVPDLIFLDYEMPVLDGEEVFQQIRKMENTKAANVPIVFLTGMSDRGHVEAAVTLKPSGYILKPVSKDRLEEVIIQILGPKNLVPVEED